MVAIAVTAIAAIVIAACAEKISVWERPNQHLSFGFSNAQQNLVKGGLEFDGSQDKSLAGTTSFFFFTNFTNDFRVQEMRKVFSRWGKVVDIFIPTKRDKVGKRFGFVTFKDAHNVRALEEQLKSIRIGNFRLQINLPRFQRRQGSNLVSAHQSTSRTREGDPVIRNGISYAVVVSNGQIGREIIKSKAFYANEVFDGRGMTFNVSEEDLKWLQGAYVGQIYDLESVFDMQNILHREGFSSIKASPMGGTSSCYLLKVKGICQNI